MEAFAKSIDFIVDRVGRVVSFIVWIGAFILFIEVVARYVFNAPTVWAHGYTQRSFGVYFIMVGAYTLLHGGHVRVDLLLNRFSFRKRKVLDIVNLLMLLIWSYALTIEGWKFFYTSWAMREVDEMVLAHPVYPVKFFLFVGGFLIGLQGVSMLIKTVLELVRGDDQ
jgi:TRAP-type mannitol/chloroaromatic compound transport system permease small subunit